MLPIYVWFIKVCIVFVIATIIKFQLNVFNML